VRRETFIDDGLVVHRLVGEARALLDGAVDGVARARGFAGGFDGGAEAGVVRRVGVTKARGDGDLLRQFSENLATLVGGFLAASVFPLRSYGTSSCCKGPVLDHFWGSAKGGQ
jgi:hypothetical protein